MSTHPDLSEATIDLTIVGDGPTGKSDIFVVLYLDVESGRQSRVLELPDGGELTFGRSRGCSVVLDHDRVSRQHSKISRRGAVVEVEDLGSRNGTLVNGQPIQSVTVVHSGDEIGIGAAVCVVGGVSKLRRQLGLGTTGYLADRLAAESDRAQRYGRNFALVMIRIGGDDDAVDAGIDRLTASLRPMDVVAEYGPDEIAVLLPEATAEVAEGVATRWQTQFRDAGVGSTSIGIAAAPLHGRTSEELLESARAALRKARNAGDRAVIVAPRGEARTGEQVRPVIADAAMQRVYGLVDKVASSPITVLILGETGVGKELVAEALHQRSPRAEKPFVTLNCASLPENLLESELFGHEKGSFTGAERRKIGYFEAAAGGTLFLDEIGEMPLSLQAKLLRVLEQRVISRVGGTEPIAVDVRVVAATHRNLEQDVAANQFRQDLFFRVSAFTIAVPPLRDRHVEVPLLIERFCDEFSRALGQKRPQVSPAAAVMLSRYAWPGNVRELRNAIERAVVLQSSGVIEPVHLPDRVRTGEFVSPTPVREPGTEPPAVVGDIRDQLAEVERASIVAALETENQNQTRAAQRLGISRRALIYKMEKFGLKALPASRA